MNAEKATILDNTHNKKWERAKTRAKETLDEWEKEGLSVGEVDATIFLLKEEMTAVYHNWQRNAPFHRVKD